MSAAAGTACCMTRPTPTPCPKWGLGDRQGRSRAILVKGALGTEGDVQVLPVLCMLALCGLAAQLCLKCCSNAAGKNGAFTWPLWAATSLDVLCRWRVDLDTRLCSQTVDSCSRGAWEALGSLAWEAQPLQTLLSLCHGQRLCRIRGGKSSHVRLTMEPSRVQPMHMTPRMMLMSYRSLHSLKCAAHKPPAMHTRTS